MSLTYGFYNSLNHDRRYDAIQMSSIFDGIIRDGVFMSIGNCLRVQAAGGMRIVVDTGRAWFNHTWTLNDARLPLQISESEIVLNRIDAVVLEINASPSVRANSIKIIKGTPSSTPSKPALTNTDSVHQHPLAYITISARAESISQANIENMIGTSACPFVTGILDTVNIDMLIAEWEAQWDDFYIDETTDMSVTNAYWKEQWSRFYVNQTNAIQNSYASWIKEWNEWSATQSKDVIDTANQWKEQWDAWYHMYVNSSTQDVANWKNINQEDFDEWFSNLQYVLDEDAGAKLADELNTANQTIEKLQKVIDDLTDYHTIFDVIEDNNTYPVFDVVEDNNSDPVLDSDSDQIDGRTLLPTNDPILDSNGYPIEGRTIFELTTNPPVIDEMTDKVNRNDSLWIRHGSDTLKVKASKLIDDIFDFLTTKDIMDKIDLKDSATKNTLIGSSDIILLQKSNGVLANTTFDNVRKSIFNVGDNISDLNDSDKIVVKRASSGALENIDFSVLRKSLLRNPENITQRRNTYVGDKLTSDPKNSTVLDAIGSGTFDGLHLGDYWMIDGIRWRIVDFDYWYGARDVIASGDTGFPGVNQNNKHHIVIMPDTSLGNSVYDDSSMYLGDRPAYLQSSLYKSGLNAAKTRINSVFGSSNILSHGKYFSNYYFYGANSWECGCNYNYVYSTIDLASEMMMSGSKMESIETESDGRGQLALFRQCPWMIPSDTWLSDASINFNFASILRGVFARQDASLSRPLIPVFAIAKP